MMFPAPLTESEWAPFVPRAFHYAARGPLKGFLKVVSKQLARQPFLYPNLMQNPKDLARLLK